MNIPFVRSFLGIVESALQNPEDKAAVKIAIDGLAAWKAVAGMAQIKQLETDVQAYLAMLPAPSPPAAVSVDPEPSGGIIFTPGGREIPTSGGATG